LFFRHLTCGSLGHRTWALILGMTGLIILFWFVAGSVALRYFVGSFLLLIPVVISFLDAFT
jgi:hypothetical protein